MIPEQGIAIPDQGIAIPKAEIAIPEPGITIFCLLFTVSGHKITRTDAKTSHVTAENRKPPGVNPDFPARLRDHSNEQRAFESGRQPRTPKTSTPFVPHTHDNHKLPDVRPRRAQKGLHTMLSPKDIDERLSKMTNAWRTLAPSKKIAGMTLQEFEEACFPSKEMRGLIEQLHAQMTQAITHRDAADANTLAKMQLVVASVVADPTEGPDGALYEAFGYTRKSERKSGLTRKRTEPAS